MTESGKLVDLLDARRKDCDILWVSRSMNPQLPHNMPAEVRLSRKEIIKAVQLNPQVRAVIDYLTKSSVYDVGTYVKEASSMVHEMASKAHLATVRWLGLLITKVIKRIFLSVYVNESTLLGLKQQMRVSQVQYIYVPTHRSYLDFILISYILFSYDMALPNIASGMDFYHMYLVGELLRHTGAFYMRRFFANDMLYKAVFRAYVNNIVEHDGRAIEFFIEGTRSRSQKSITPKFGLLSTILESYVKGNVTDIYFVPISISYDRPPEELLFVYELMGIPKPKESTSGLFRSLSILQKVHSYGQVFFNISDPIPASSFVGKAHRKAIILDPTYKLDQMVIKNLAYSIIESHKRNIVITSFNIIALLFNEKTQMCTENPYTIHSLTEDYIWCKRFMRFVMNAKVYPEEYDIAAEDVKKEILVAMQPHEELITFDVSNTLRLRERHQATNVPPSLKVKGHNISKEVMRIAVPAINIAIYTNATFAFLVNPSIIALTITKDGMPSDKALQQYYFVRSLLTTEFALYPEMDIDVVNTEWKEVLTVLLGEQCLQIVGNLICIGENIKLFYLLRNLILPFIDAVYVTAVVLFEWSDDTCGIPTDQSIFTECQKRVEEKILQRNSHCYHPYCLSLDLFKTTLTHFESQAIVLSTGKEKVLRADKMRLAQLIAQLKTFLLERPPGSYMDITLVASLENTKKITAKL